MNQCPRCAAPVQPNDKFCGSCAAPVPRAPDVAPGPPAAYPGAPPAYQQPGFAPAPAYNQPYPQPPTAGVPAPVYARQPAFPIADTPPGFAPPQQAYAAQPQAPYGAAAPSAGRCEHGHDVTPGANYCPFGHPLALGDMKFAGGDAFGPTAFADGPSPMPSTGAMSPFPGAGQPPAYSAAGAAGPTAPGPYDPGAFGQPPGAYAPPAQDYAPPPPQAYAPQPQAYAPQPQAYVPAAQPQQQWGAPEPSADGWGAPAPQPAQAMAPQAMAPQPAQAMAPQPMAPQPMVVDPAAVTGPADPLSRILKGFLVSFHNQPTGTFWPLYTAKNMIGRAQSGEALDIEINDPTTSSRHAQISFDSPHGPSLEDLGSTNGTFLNDQPVGYQGSVELHDGDRIRFGGYNTVIRLVSN